MAIHLKESKPNDDVWAIFARNWGNEGYCSQNQHFLPVEGNQVKLILPAIFPGASGPELLPSTSFQASDRNVKWSWAPVSQGILFTATLLKPDARSRINGELHIKWEVGPSVASAGHGFSLSRQDLMLLSNVKSIQGPQKEESFETEKTLSNMLRSLPAEELKQLESNLSVAVPPVAPDVVPAAQVEAGLPKNPFRTFEFMIPPSPKEVPAEVSVRDAEKLERDRLQAIAICDAKKKNPQFVPELTMEACKNLVDKNRY
jgi:hypothetical protein